MNSLPLSLFVMVMGLVALILGNSPAAQAAPASAILSFDLAPAPSAVAPADPATLDRAAAFSPGRVAESESSPPDASTDGSWFWADNGDRLAIPDAAATAPLGYPPDDRVATLPPPPAGAPPPAAATSAQPIELEFQLPIASPPDAPAGAVAAVPPAVPLSTAAASDYTLDSLFTGDSESLVARAVGSAEGTRTSDGGRNLSYYGHVDPGNGAWNLGTFSYQHGADSPEEADRKQLQRLRYQAEAIQAQAIAKGLTLSLEESLNAIDLANQAPKAALDAAGYVDWLAKAHQSGKQGTDAILWARTQSFFDPNMQTWNAPGLGNTQDSIAQDQARRMQAIASAIAVQPQSSPQLAQQPQQTAPSAQPVKAQKAAKAIRAALTEEQGMARLFAQKVTGIFEPEPLEEGVTPVPPDNSGWGAPGLNQGEPLNPRASRSMESESTVAQQILDLDLSAP